MQDIVSGVVFLVALGIVGVVVGYLFRSQQQHERAMTELTASTIERAVGAITVAATETARTILLPADGAEIAPGRGGNGDLDLPLARVMPDTARTTITPADDPYSYWDPTDNDIPEGHWDGAVSVPRGFSEAQARALGIGRISDAAVGYGEVH